MNGFDGCAWLPAARNIRLIGDDDEREVVGLQVEQRRCDLGQQVEFLNSSRRVRLAIANGSAVEDAIAVEKNCWTKLRAFRSGRFPLGLLLLDRGMRHQQMPHEGLKRFCVRSDVSRVDRRNKDADVSDFRSVAAIAANDAEDLRADGLRVLQSS